MTGFLFIAALYVGLWALLLLPGAAVLLSRDRPARPPADDPDPHGWVAQARREIASRARGRRLEPADVPVTQDVPRRLPSVSVEASVVEGSLRIPDGSFVNHGLVVRGDLRVGEGARLLAPVWVRGSAMLADGSETASLIVDGSLRLGSGASVHGAAWAGKRMKLDPDARVDGPACSAQEIVLEPGAVVGSAFAPFVRGGDIPDDVDVVPRTEAEPFDPEAWPRDLDDVLGEVWPRGRLNEIVDEIEERTGVRVRQLQVLRRARRLRLTERGIPRRPRLLGRRPAWVLTLESIRVGADLRIPEGAEVGYSLVVEGALEVFGDAVLEAPVRSGRGLLLHPGVVVHGAATSDGLVVLQEGSTVLGPVDSSIHVLLFANARVGVPGACGVHAMGAIGLEPGAEIIGGAVGRLGVRGEPLRPEPLRSQGDEPDAEDETPRGRKRRRRRRRKARSTS